MPALAVGVKAAELCGERMAVAMGTAGAHGRDGSRPIGSGVLGRPPQREAAEPADLETLWAELVERPRPEPGAQGTGQREWDDPVDRIPGRGPIEGGSRSSPCRAPSAPFALRYNLQVY